MTKDALCKILERFSILSIKTSQSELTPEEQHDVIVDAIEHIAETVIICVKRGASRPNYN